MKKVIGVLVLAAVLVTAAVCLTGRGGETEYIRIHIRANSNSEYDQNIKYAVKDSVVDFITPLAKEISDKDTMYSVLENNLEGIRRTVDDKLSSLGQGYKSRVRLNREEFPTRTYEDLTLEGGIYDALIIELGSGKGDNWWCVAFPPLCFSGERNETGKVTYKSVMKEWFLKLTSGS